MKKSFVRFILLAFAAALIVTATEFGSPRLNSSADDEPAAQPARVPLGFRPQSYKAQER